MVGAFLRPMELSVCASYVRIGRNLAAGARSRTLMARGGNPAASRLGGPGRYQGSGRPRRGIPEPVKLHQAAELAGILAGRGDTQAGLLLTRVVLRGNPCRRPARSGADARPSKLIITCHQATRNNAKATSRNFKATPVT